MKSRWHHWPMVIAIYIGAAIALGLTLWNFVQFPIAVVRHWMGWW